MAPRYAVGLVALLAASVLGGDARAAAVTLRSAELTEETGSWAVAGDWRYTSRTLPFPNDSDAFADVGPDGLRVFVDILYGSYFRQSGRFPVRSWSDEGFRVRFSVDEPMPFAYHRGTLPGDVGTVSLLSDDGATPLIGARQFGDVSGVLPPGGYTLVGDTNARSLGDLPLSDYSAGSRLHDVRLTVPEPPAMTLAAAVLVYYFRRPGKAELSWSPG